MSMDMPLTFDAAVHSGTMHLKFPYLTTEFSLTWNIVWNESLYYFYASFFSNNIYIYVVFL